MSGPVYPMLAPGAGATLPGSSRARRSPDSPSSDLAYNRVELPGANQSPSAPLYPSDSAVEPGSRNELIDGQLVEAMPAHAPHGDRHSELDYVLRAHAAPGYQTSSDMLTRTSLPWEIAADASIRKALAADSTDSTPAAGHNGSGAPVDPEPVRRHLEEMVFEIKSTQSERDLTARARQFADRGVRRVFGIWVSGDIDGKQVENGPVKEWSRDEERWIEFAEDDVIDDPCLARPMAIRALLDAAAADDAVVEALAAKNNPALERHKRESYESGKRDGLRQHLHDLCDAYDIELTAEHRARIDELDIAGLQALRRHIKTHRRLPK